MSVGILITARLKSTRLKEKVLKPIMGKPMLSHMIDRLRLAKTPEKIIICTSPVEQDDRLYDFAMQNGLECFRGDPDDVLFRMLSAADKYDIDTIISCTADNPFVDPEYIDRLVDFHVQQDNDFTRSEGLPFGTFAYALKREAVRKACEIKDAVDTEVWGGYFTETNLFKCGVLQVTDDAVRAPELRLTVDTQEDFDLVTEIFNRLSKPNQIFSLREIVALCRSDPDLTKMNASVIQKQANKIKIKSVR